MYTVASKPIFLAVTSAGLKCFPATWNWKQMHKKYHNLSQCLKIIGNNSQNFSQHTMRNWDWLQFNIPSNTSLVISVTDLQSVAMALTVRRTTNH